MFIRLLPLHANPELSVRSTDVDKRRRPELWFGFTFRVFKRLLVTGQSFRKLIIVEACVAGAPEVFDYLSGQFFFFITGIPLLTLYCFKIGDFIFSGLLKQLGCLAEILSIKLS